MGSDGDKDISGMQRLDISIHAPRMGSDAFSSFCLARQTDFNPRSPHGERQYGKMVTVLKSKFQSTLPAWGATEMAHRQLSQHQISIHAPRMGSDQRGRLRIRCRCYFNPRSPHGERRWNTQDWKFEFRISIHAPRMGSDSTVKAYSNDRIKRSTLREPHFLYSKNAYFSPIVSMCATTSRKKKSENQSFIRIISRLGTYVFHLRLVSIPQIIEPYAVRLPVHQHFQCGTK